MNHMHGKMWEPPTAEEVKVKYDAFGYVIERIKPGEIPVVDELGV